MLFLPIEGKRKNQQERKKIPTKSMEGPATSSESGGDRQRDRHRITWTETATETSWIFSRHFLPIIRACFFLLNVWDNVILSDTYTSRRQSPGPAPSASDSDGNGNEQRRPRPLFPVAKGFWRKMRHLATPFYHPIFPGTLSAPYIPSLFRPIPSLSRLQT